VVIAPDLNSCSIVSRTLAAMMSRSWVSDASSCGWVATISVGFTAVVVPC
jgi:hypothetical protein